MEIEEFIEQDILIFLDDTLDKVRAAPPAPAPVPSLFITRDYEKELFAALDKNDTHTAKRVLHTLKKQFDECPNGTPDKQQLKLLLVTLYDKFKEHIDAQDTFEKIEQRIDGKRMPEPVPQEEMLAKEMLTIEAAASAAQSTAKQDATAQDAASAAAHDAQDVANTAAQHEEPANAQAKQIAETKTAPENVPAELTQQKPSEQKQAEQKQTEQSAPARQETAPNVLIIRELLARAEHKLQRDNVEEAVRAYKQAKLKAQESEGTLPPDLLAQYKQVYLRIKGALLDLKTRAAAQDVPGDQARQAGTCQASNQAGNIRPVSNTQVSNTRASHAYHAGSSASDHQASRQSPSPREPAYPHHDSVPYHNPTNTRKALPEAMPELPRMEEMTPEEMDKQLLLQLEQEKHKLDAMLRRNDLEGGMRQYRKMRVLAQQLSKQRARSAEAKLARIYTLISNIQQHAAHNEQKLVAVP
jgi:hypothetical protein